MRLLVTGSTGFIGGQLVKQLSSTTDHEVVCLVRDRQKALDLEAAGCCTVQGDVLQPDSLKGVFDGVDAAYYLIHSMGEGSGGHFAELDQRAAYNFAAAASQADVGRVIYLGGLGDSPDSPHLISRQQTAETLSKSGPPLTYFRASMVVGSGSASFQTLNALVKRLPVMLTPSWLNNMTQPIDIDDVIAYLVEALELEGVKDSEVQIGGPDRMTYRQMLDVMSNALGRRPSIKVPVPLLTPWLSSHWIGLVTPVNRGIAKALVESLSSETVVTDESAAQKFSVKPIRLSDSILKALQSSYKYRPI